ncbi:hypothetical protein MED134_13336 [Dokdonia sp. MED134]|uniref:hypothetical protein n=1 Tax=Dokdonia sp. MED134 TaxID=313590 RepID=UPI000068B17D|nr:hypothetical protein [Dokdonia sp. MED134]EAQ37747.1 hypothetical protein MED134_13336 [Dokdonia sp. MED134]
MLEGKRHIAKYTSRWQLLLVIQGLLYGIGAGVFCWLLSRQLGISMLVFTLVTGLAMLVLKPWRITATTVSEYLDHHLSSAEYSTSLLFTETTSLSGLGQLQQHKVSTVLQEQINTIRPKTSVKTAAIVAFMLIGAGYVGSQFIVPPVLDNGDSQKEVIQLQSTDSITPLHAPPVLKQQQVTIQYPSYTKLASRTTSIMNVKAVEGSKLFWSLDFEGFIKEVTLEGLGTGKKFNLKRTNENSLRASASLIPTTSGYYNFNFIDSLDGAYTSDIYAIEVVKDQPPAITIKDIAQFTTFEHTDRKVIDFSALITDDFGIESAQIIATVSKGEGESVKFREEKIAFDAPITKGIKTMTATKSISLDALKMELGDELYFYVETRDQKTPKPNITRSETYFAVIKDTVSDGFGVEGTMGADLMPDYFRSQRQLIIDTEKLIKDRNTLTKQEFTNRSNELGFDQKALRLKYGKFMGDEDDSGIGVAQDIDMSDYDEDDPTAGFRHDHDTENEHNLVEEDHDHEHEEESEGEEEKETSLFEDYLHNHDDPEESTLFTESLRGKLKNAMAQMWDAELHLRLADPDTSLPYQYKALKLIQEIKNSARIYVHRIGFDPPPIKEDKRLSGEIKEITNVFKKEDFDNKDPYVSMRESIEILEKRLQNERELTEEDKTAFAKAGEELAQLAILEPSRHLLTLQKLKWLTEDKKQPKTVIQSVQKGLLEALPRVSETPKNPEGYTSKLESLFTKELQKRD